jgi:hypothetical protein
MYDETQGPTFYISTPSLMESARNRKTRQLRRIMMVRSPQSERSERMVSGYAIVYLLGFDRKTDAALLWLLPMPVCRVCLENIGECHCQGSFGLVLLLLLLRRYIARCFLLTPRLLFPSKQVALLSATDRLYHHPLWHSSSPSTCLINTSFANRQVVNSDHS